MSSLIILRCILSDMRLSRFDFVKNQTCVSRVEPQRAVLIRKMSWPSGSPISSAMRWNVDRGTTIRRRQNFICAMYTNGAYSLRQRCIPVNHDSGRCDAIRCHTLESCFVLVHWHNQIDSALYPPWDGKMSTSQRAVMLCGWKGNRMPGEK